jgi:protein CpxP
MKMAKKLILASVVLPLVLSTGSAFAFGGNGQKDHQVCRSGLDRGMLKELNLTDEQKEQFKSLRKASREDNKAKRDNADPKQRNAMQEQRLEQLNNLLLAEKFDPTKATQIAKEMSQKRITRQVEKLNEQHKMLSILTAKQKNTFVELQKEHLDECIDDMRDHKSKHDK